MDDATVTAVLFFIGVILLAVALARALGEDDD